MIRYNIFKELRAAITAITDESGDRMVEHVGMWNENLEFAEQDTPWARPAVYVEFGTIEWRADKDDSWRSAPAEIYLHIVTDYVSEKDYAVAFEIGERIAIELENITPQAMFTTPLLVSSRTSHNHGELLETIDTYTLRMLRCGVM